MLITGNTGSSISENSLSKHLAFFVIAGMTVAMSYPYQQGISPFDPGDYTRCAVQLLRGEWDFQNFYCNRIGTYLPIALAIKIFGFNGYYLTWVTTFELIVLMAVAYFALRRYNYGISIITCMLIGFSPVMLELSGTLFGDIMAALTANLCILWIWHIRFISSKPKLVLGGILLALMWFFALATKESAVYYLVPMLILFIYDLRKRQFTQFWFAAIITGAVVGAVILVVYVLTTGDILYRLRIVEEGPNVGRDTYLRSSWQIIFTRLTILPVKFMIENYSFYVVFLPSLLFLFSEAQNEKERFFKMYMVSLTAMWWLGSQSFRTWIPVLLIDRLWLPVLIPMTINAAHVYYSVGKGNIKGFATARSRLILAVMAVVILISGATYDYELSSDQITIPEFLLPRMSLLVLLFLAIFHREDVKCLMKFSMEFARKYKHYFFVILILLANVIYFNTNLIVLWQNPKDNNYNSEKEMIDMVLKTAQHVTVLCDKALSDNYGIYFGFDLKEGKQVDFLDWNATDSLQIIQLAMKQPVYLLITQDRLRWYVKNSALSRAMYPYVYGRSSIPAFVLNPGLNWEVVKSNTRSTLYRYGFAHPPSDGDQ